MTISVASKKTRLSPTLLLFPDKSVSTLSCVHGVTIIFARYEDVYLSVYAAFTYYAAYGVSIWVRSCFRDFGLRRFRPSWKTISTKLKNLNGRNPRAHCKCGDFHGYYVQVFQIWRLKRKCSLPRYEDFNFSIKNQIKQRNINWYSGPVTSWAPLSPVAHFTNCIAWIHLDIVFNWWDWQLLVVQANHQCSHSIMIELCYFEMFETVSFFFCAWLLILGDNMGLTHGAAVCN